MLPTITNVLRIDGIMAMNSRPADEHGNREEEDTLQLDVSQD